MRHATITRFIVLIFLCLGVTCTTAMAQQGMEAEILTLINKHRAKKGLSPLQYNAAIAQASEKHSRNMASGRIPMGHSGFDERTDRLIKDIKGADAAAENVAYGAKTAERVVEMWLDSKGHRKNIEGNYNLTGIGVVRNRKGVLYYTQIFIHKK